jgi:hypothetical protein
MPRVAAGREALVRYTVAALKVASVSGCGMNRLKSSGRAVLLLVLSFHRLISTQTRFVLRKVLICYQCSSSTSGVVSSLYSRVKDAFSIYELLPAFTASLFSERPPKQSNVDLDFTSSCTFLSTSRRPSPTRRLGFQLLLLQVLVLILLLLTVSSQ